MEKRKVYYSSIKNLFTWLSTILIICSVLAQIYLCCEKGTASGFPFLSQILLPIVSEALFLAIVLFDGREHLYRTSVPIFLLALSFFFATFSYTLWHKLLSWFLCLAYFILYHKVISGTVKSRFDRVSLVTLSLVILAIRVYVQDYYYLGYRSFASFCGDLPVILTMLGVFCLILSLKQYDDGKYHPFWGDRLDGRSVRSLEPMTYVAVYIMPTRNESSNSFKVSIDVTEIDKYIHKKRREDIPTLTLTQIVLAAYCRVVAKYPAINRFISGQRIFSRDDDIVFNMAVKREMSTDGEETMVKLHFKPEDTLSEVSKKLDDLFKNAKAETGSGFDKAAAILSAIPGLVMKFTVWLLNVLDYFGLLPGFLLEVSPFHGSVILTSMASLGIPAIYHHLYDFGNMPVFVCLGAKYRENVVNKDGSVEEHKFVDITVVTDERICDGFYYATAFKEFKRLISHPERLEVPPETVVRDVM